ncbi:MAG: ATP-binding protein [Chloroflexi bacterium]|nr:ATP-binding protein [Chloroflexota bacterium]
MAQALDKSKYTILIVDDDEDARLVLKMMVQRDGYQVYEAADGLEGLQRFEEVHPDVVLMDAMMPRMDGFTAAQKIIEDYEDREVPVVMVTALNDDGSIQRAFKIGASDYITKPVQVSVMRHRIERLVRTKAAEDGLHKIISDQRFLSRLDRDLGYTLNTQRVLTLTMDIVLRRSGGSSCTIGVINRASRRLERAAALGGPKWLEEPVPEQDLLNDNHPLSLAFSESSQIHEVPQSDDRVRLLVPLVVEGKPEGVVVVDNVMARFLDQTDRDFLQQVASRAAITLSKTRLYERSQLYNKKLDYLHQISTAISSSLNRDDMLEMSTRGLAVLLDGSSAFFCDYDRRNKQLMVRANFVVEGMADTPPDVNKKIDVTKDGDAMKRLHEGVVQFQASRLSDDDPLNFFVMRFGLTAGMAVPRLQDDVVESLIVVADSRFERHFSDDEVGLARSLGDHITVMLQQANLFANIKELEEVKSEMIRMASHDLKNPLLQVRGYLDLLLKTMGEALSEQQREFASRITSGTDKMNNLLEDILNLERIESHSTTQLDTINLRFTLHQVVESLRPHAELKRQYLSANIGEEDAYIMGNELQLQQAFNNFINNAIKYTPEAGKVTVRGRVEDGEFHFEVEDNGYGIPKDRQDKLFERFYRARTPGTEDIPGTGLGLSLVKSVVQRHGGDVWFKSEEGKGSTFGIWLPVKPEPAEKKEAK